MSKRFWTALVLFGLTGQVAWVVENMYLNVFIYKMFHASAADISAMVSASAVAAALTTIFMGALSDRVGKRRLFISGGYVIWGITILGFSAIRMEFLTPICQSTVQAAALGVTLVIVLDCVMTFFGSTANDAAFNAWLTDLGTEKNRGRIEGINAMMPMVAILVVFGGFMGVDLDQATGWTLIFILIGAAVLILGILGFKLIEEPKRSEAGKEEKGTFLADLVCSFRPGMIRKYPGFYAVILAFAVFGISIQIFMPYLILYYEQSLQMANYVLIMAPAILIAAAVTAVYGKYYDRYGFYHSCIPSFGMLMTGYAVLYCSRAVVWVFIGSLLMMCGYLTGMAVFGARIRELMPQNMAGRFQGMRIIGQVLIPGVVGPAIGARVLRDAEMIPNQDGTFSFLPNEGIWLAAFVAGAVLILLLLVLYGRENGKSRKNKQMYS